MGCDFWWTGRIPDPEQQAAVASLFRKYFDWSGRWASIEPNTERHGATLFSRSSFSELAHLKSSQQHVESSYPCDYFGVASYLERTRDQRLLNRGQMVFDRTDNGRFVSIVPVERMEGATGLAAEGIVTVVQPGGYLRLIGEFQCRALALFLNLVRLRHCPDLDAQDDRLYIEAAAEDLRSTGAEGEVTARGFEPIKFLNKRLEGSIGFLPAQCPQSHELDGGTGDYLGFDFQPFMYAWRSWAQGIGQDLTSHWEPFVLAYLRAVFVRLEAVGRAPRRDLPLVLRLRIALTEIWNEDGFAEIIEFGTADPGKLRIVRSLGGADQVVTIPKERLEEAIA